MNKIFSISEGTINKIYVAFSIIFTIASIGMIVNYIYTEKEEIEVEYTYNDYINETAVSGYELADSIYSLIASGELDEYYSDEELETLKEFGIR